MDTRATLLRRALPGLLLWGLAGCELLVTGDVPAIHCSVEGAVGLPDCPIDQVCKGGSCVQQSTLEHPLGSGCQGDADCGFGDFCLDPAVYGGAGIKRCSRPCCSSSGCDPNAGFVCWSPGQGGVSFCLPAADVHRDPPGVDSAGVACKAGTDCRSGRCDATGACLDLCCSDQSCALGGDTCQFGARDGAFRFTCAPPPVDKKSFFDSCVADAECGSGLCLDFGTGVRHCSAPCCNSASCAVSGTQALPVACTYVAHNGAWVRACAEPLPSTKVNTVGQPCQKDADCRGGRCALPLDPQQAGMCTDACCSDAACGEGGDFQCRPETMDSSWVLRCERK